MCQAPRRSTQEVLDRVPALKELLDDLRKEKGVGQKLVSIAGLPPLSVVSGNGRAHKGTPWTVSKTHMHRLHMYKIHVQSPHNYRMCVTRHKMHMCLMWAGFVCRVHMCLGRVGVAQELHLPKPGWQDGGKTPGQPGLSRLRLVLALCGGEEVL